MKRPAFQFYPGDWMHDSSVRALSFAARGLWIDMLCLMHSGKPYGHLTIGKNPVDEKMLARLFGSSTATVRSLVAELEANEVFSRTDDGVIFSRRMVRDENSRALRAAGGVRSLENPNASRRGDARAGGRPRGSPQTPLGGLEGFKNNPLDNPPSSSSSSSLPSVPEGHPGWVLALEAEVAAVQGIELKALTLPQRSSLGRYHALRYAFCRTSEANNRSKGGGITAALATMCVSDQFGDFTVAEYVAKADEYHATIGKRPWYKPWEIRAVCDETVLDRRVKRG